MKQYENKGVELWLIGYHCWSTKDQCQYPDFRFRNLGIELVGL